MVIIERTKMRIAPIKRFIWQRLIYRRLALVALIVMVSGCGSVPPPGTAPVIPEEPVTDSTQTDSAEAVTADSDGTSATAAEKKDDEESVAEEVANTAAGEESSQAAVASANEAAIPPLGRISEDFTLVGATGRPQLVYTYADW